MSPPAFRATFPGVSYQLGNVRYDHLFRLCFTHPYIHALRWFLPHQLRSKLVRSTFFSHVQGGTWTLTCGTAAGNHIQTTIIVDGVPKRVADYATVQGILIGVVAAYVVVVTILGPECVTLPLLL